MSTAENTSVRPYFELSGSMGGDVLVLLNSLGSSMHMWDRVLPAFEKTHRVLRYDMRGHGQSNALPGPDSIGQLGEDLLSLLDDLRLDRVDLCGLSLGGLVAMWIAIHAPERVRRVVMANTAARIGTPEAWEQRIEAVHRAGMAPLAEASISRWFTPAYKDSHAEEMESLRAMIVSTDAKAYAACCGVLRDTDLRSELGSINSPCLIITGTHDPATPPSDGHALHASLRQSTYVELDASHMSAWEQPEAFAGAVHSFLVRGENTHG